MVYMLNKISFITKNQANIEFFFKTNILKGRTHLLKPFFQSSQ